MRIFLSTSPSPPSPPPQNPPQPQRMGLVEKYSGSSRKEVLSKSGRSSVRVLPAQQPGREQRRRSHCCVPEEAKTLDSDIARSRKAQSARLAEQVFEIVEVCSPIVLHHYIYIYIYYVWSHCMLQVNIIIIIIYQVTSLWMSLYYIWIFIIAYAPSSCAFRWHRYADRGTFEGVHTASRRPDGARSSRCANPSRNLEVARGSRDVHTRPLASDTPNSHVRSYCRHSALLRTRWHTSDRSRNRAHRHTLSCPREGHDPKLWTLHHRLQDIWISHSLGSWACCRSHWCSRHRRYDRSALTPPDRERRICKCCS